MTPKQYKEIVNRLENNLKYLIKDIHNNDFREEDIDKEYRSLIEKRIWDTIGETFAYKEEGASRAVFISKNINYVIKINIDTTMYGNQNRTEWNRWNQYKRTKYGKLLAPCFAISDKKSILLQAEVKLSRKNISQTKNMDNHIFNKLTSDGAQTGIYNGKVVVYDYGLGRSL